MGEKNSKYEPENPGARKRRLERARMDLTGEMLTDLADFLDTNNIERQKGYGFRREFPAGYSRTWRAYVYKKECSQGFDIRDHAPNPRLGSVESVLVKVESSDRFYEGGVLDVELHNPELRPVVEQFVQFYWKRFEEAGATDFTIGVVEPEKSKE